MAVPQPRGFVNILLIEDDTKTAGFVSKGLRQEGFVVHHSKDGREGLTLALHEDFDVAIIDVMLPSLSGFEVVRELRKCGKTLPVLILSCRGAVADKVKGLEQGADDYLAKPFAFAELIARVQALLRRAKGTDAEPTRLSARDLTVDLLSRKVHRGGTEIDLQPREFALLEYLLRNAGRVLSKTMIIEHVWGYDFDPGTNVVETRMSRLRDKIDGPFEKHLIETIRGVGYVLRKEA